MPDKCEICGTDKDLYNDGFALKCSPCWAKEREADRLRHAMLGHNVRRVGTVVFSGPWYLYACTKCRSAFLCRSDSEMWQLKEPDALVDGGAKIIGSAIHVCSEAAA